MLYFEMNYWLSRFFLILTSLCDRIVLKKGFDMAKTSTSFKEGNRFWELVKNAGRPAYWTEERIDELIVQLGEWADRPTSIIIAGFKAEYGITDDMLQHIKNRSADFAKAYHLTKQKLAERISQQCGKKVHQAHYNRCISMYDTEMKYHEIEMTNVKAQAEAAAKAEIEEKARASMLEFVKLFRSHSSDECKTDDTSSNP